MTREIKFRAWEENRKLMLYSGDYLSSLNQEGLCINFNGDIIVVRHIKKTEYSMGFARIGYDLILMQYTGLKDKDKVDIYEGDIIQCNCKEEKDGRWIKFVVGYDKGSFSGEKKYPMSDKSHAANAKANEDKNFKFILYSLWERYELKVIGNIYENQTL